LADAQDSGSCARKGVGVQVPPRARLDDRNASFFDRLAAPDAAAVRTEGVQRRFRSGEFLCREGDNGAGVVVVLSGYVKLTKSSVSGRETMLELRGAGDVLGEMSLVDGQPQSANAVALGEVDALVVASDRINRLRAERASIANALLAVAVRRLRQASARQHELGTVDVVSRVCRRLAELAAIHGEQTGAGVVVRALSQQELADWAGASRDGVVRALHELRNEGLLESGRGRIVIKNLGAISDRAGTDGAFEF
jgi:CRP/FNR family cyclic AMP-dependent transcriptional regulator